MNPAATAKVTAVVLSLARSCSNSAFAILSSAVARSPRSAMIPLTSEAIVLLSAESERTLPASPRCEKPSGDAEQHRLDRIFPYHRYDVIHHVLDLALFEIAAGAFKPIRNPVRGRAHRFVQGVFPHFPRYVFDPAAKLRHKLGCHSIRAPRVLGFGAFSIRLFAILS